MFRKCFLHLPEKYLESIMSRKNYDRLWISQLRRLQSKMHDSCSSVRLCVISVKTIGPVSLTLTKKFRYSWIRSWESSDGLLWEETTLYLQNGCLGMAIKNQIILWLFNGIQQNEFHARYNIASSLFFSNCSLFSTLPKWKVIPGENGLECLNHLF